MEFDDVLLVPQPSKVNSREDVNLLYDFGWGKRYPIFSAPMKGITSYKFIKACHESNIIGLTHRFDSPVARVNLARKLNDNQIDFGFSIGMGIPETALAGAVSRFFSHCRFICVDVANGYTEALVNCIRELKHDLPEEIKIISGNVVTPEGVKNLQTAGADYVRVGIGTGNLCTTRQVTGVGLPQATALSLCKYQNQHGIISDGGMDTSGKAVKSFALGADFVMIGSLFASAKEADNKGLIYGMASRKLQMDTYGSVKSIEGRELHINNKLRRPLKEIVDEYVNGIKSACTYLNVNSIDELKNGKINIFWNEKVYSLEHENQNFA